MNYLNVWRFVDVRGEKGQPPINFIQVISANWNDDGEVPAPILRQAEQRMDNELSYKGRWVRVGTLNHKIADYRMFEEDE